MCTEYSEEQLPPTYGEERKRIRKGEENVEKSHECLIVSDLLNRTMIGLSHSRSKIPFIKLNQVILKNPIPDIHIHTSMYATQ